MSSDLPCVSLVCKDMAVRTARAVQGLCKWQKRDMDNEMSLKSSAVLRKYLPRKFTNINRWAWGLWSCNIPLAWRLPLLTFQYYVFLVYFHGLFDRTVDLSLFVRILSLFWDLGDFGFTYQWSLGELWLGDVYVICFSIAGHVMVWVQSTDIFLNAHWKSLVFVFALLENLKEIGILCQDQSASNAVNLFKKWTGRNPASKPPTPPQKWTGRKRIEGFKREFIVTTAWWQPSQECSNHWLEERPPQLYIKS